MNSNSGVNKAFLVGYADEEPVIQIINGKQFFCFRFITIEDVKKGADVYEHSEIHHIKVPLKMGEDSTAIHNEDLLYIQGRIQTRIVFENDVKLYKTEILATSIEHLSPAGIVEKNSVWLNGSRSI